MTPQMHDTTETHDNKMQGEDTTTPPQQDLTPKRGHITTPNFYQSKIMVNLLQVFATGLHFLTYPILCACCEIIV